VKPENKQVMELLNYMYDAIFIPEGVIKPGREILNI
jgi:hypothetical protein